MCGEEAAGFRAVARHIDHRRGRAATAAEQAWLRRGPEQSGQRRVRGDAGSTYWMSFGRVGVDAGGCVAEGGD